MTWIKGDKRRANFTTDPRGKISCGAKDDKGNMFRFSYFNVEKYPEIQDAYETDTPSKLLIEFPASGTLEEIIDFKMVEWGAGKMKRFCDRITQTILRDNVADMIDGKKKAYRKGTEHPCTFPDCECKTALSVIARIINPRTGAAVTDLVRIYNGSGRSGENFLTQIEDLQNEFALTEQARTEVVRCFYWIVTVEMGNAKFGKTPILKLRKGPAKIHRKAINLLEEHGITLGDGAFGEIKQLVAGEFKDAETKDAQVINIAQETADRKEQEARQDRENAITARDIFGVDMPHPDLTKNNKKDNSTEKDNKNNYIEFHSDSLVKSDVLPKNDVEGADPQNDLFQNSKSSTAPEHQTENANTDSASNDTTKTDNPKTDNPFTILLNRCRTFTTQEQFNECLIDLNSAENLTYQEKKKIRDELFERKEQM